MNNRAVTLSIAMAIMAVMLVQSYVESEQKKNEDKFGQQVNIVVAKKDISEMETINRSHLELKQVPKAFRQPAAIYFDNTENTENKKLLEGLVGNVALVPIRQGEQITYNKITQPSVRTGLSPQVAPGRRAVSVPVNEVGGVGKLLKPGDRIDVIASTQVGQAKESRLSRTFFQDLVVLAVGKYISNNPPRKVDVDPISGKERVFNLAEDMNYNNVVLEVDPVQAQTLAYLMSDKDTTIFLSLRNNDDTERLNMPPITFGDIMGAEAGRALNRQLSGGPSGGGPGSAQ